jgi:Tfp pilus assembly protein PilZ
MTLPARTREILIVGPAQNSAPFKDKLSRHLNNAFHDLPGAPFHWDFQGLGAPSELGNYVTSHEIPLLVVLDPSDAARPPESPEWDAVCSGLRNLDPLACILVLVPPTSPTAALGIGWLDRGASGLLNIDSSEASTADALRDMLSQPLRVKVPRKLRVNATHHIQLQLASLEQALVAETLNVGLGGIFVRAVPQNIAIGDDVEFVLEFSRQVSGNSGPDNNNPLVNLMNADETPSSSKQTAESIRGLGQVVWVRSTAQNGVPEGIGLQFKDVDAAGFKKIQEFVASHRIKAFIPKS